MADLYDVLVNYEQTFLVLDEGGSLSVVAPYERDWTKLNMEIWLYTLALEQDDATAAATHLATIEDILDTSGITVTLNNLQRSYRKQAFSSISASTTWAAAEGSLLHGIDIKFVSGTPTVRVGTTLGGDEIMGDRVITASADSNNMVRKSFLTATTVYITVSGGTVTLNLDYEINYF